MKEYLTEINQGLEISERPVHCEILAPNAPEQNPVEDIWLKAKIFLRQFWYKLNSFTIVKWLFEFFLQKEVFNFPNQGKLGESGSTIAAHAPRKNDHRNRRDRASFFDRSIVRIVELICLFLLILGI